MPLRTYCVENGFSLNIISDKADILNIFETVA